MKKNILTLIIVLVLAAIALILVITSSKTTFRKAISDFAVNDTSIVTKIFMSDKLNNTLTLSREIGSNWMVNNKHKVRKDAIRIFLKTLHNVAVTEPVSKAEHNSVIKRLATKSIKVEIYQYKYRVNIFNWIKLFSHEKLTKTYYVGGSTQNNIGTYMLMENSTTPFITSIPGFRGFISIRYSATEADWRDHTIFNQRLSEIKSIKLEFSEYPEQSFLIQNNDNGLTLKSLFYDQFISDFDTLKLLDYITSFDNIKFEALLNNMEIMGKDSILNSKPFNIISLTNKRGEKYIVKTFQKHTANEEFDLEGNPILYDRDRLYALVNNDKDFVLIQYFVFDKILRPLIYFKQHQ